MTGLEHASHRKELEKVVLETIPEGSKMFVSIADHYRNEGRIEGERKGERKGIVKGKAGMLLKQIRYRWGGVPEAAVRTIERAKEPQLDVWLLRVIDAKTVEDVFVDPTDR